MKFLAGILLPLLLAAPSFAQNAAAQEDFFKGLALEYSPQNSSDYKGAADYYEKAARGGSREALLALARLSAPEGPLWQNGAAWRERLLAASRAGWPEAAERLAQALEKNEIPKSLDLNPAQYYLQAAASGRAAAARRLAEMYLEGASGLARDEKMAAQWFAVAAENHDEASALALGKLYYKQNATLAAHWLSRTNLPEAAFLLGEIRLKEGRFIEAVSAFTAAADQGHPAAHLSLGILNLDNDFGRRPDPREALRHLKIAAQADLPEAAYQLAHMYIEGRATPKDSISGAFWLHRAAEKGHARAGEEYGKLTYNFSIGQKKRLERMIEEGLTPTMQTVVQ